MYKTPFLSVCLIATTRESTIFNSLRSLCEQNFRDFEVVVTIRKYDDNTLEEINRFKSTALFRENIDKFKIYKINKKYDDIDEWNDPLKFAVGEYVGILEGDDEFGSSHLQDVYNKIMDYPNIGLYATGNSRLSCDKLGFIKSNEYYKYILSFIDTPPPSQVFFKRVGVCKMSYHYNVKDFVYAPEIDLYLRIMKDGYNSYHSDNNDVVRSFGSYTSGLGFKYFQDTVKLIELNRDKYNFKELLNVNILIKKRMLKSFLKGIIRKRKIDWKLLRGMLNVL